MAARALILVGDWLSAGTLSLKQSQSQGMVTILCAPAYRSVYEFNTDRFIYHITAALKQNGVSRLL